jgi:hypothetical protein
VLVRVGEEEMMPATGLSIQISDALPEYSEVTLLEVVQAICDETNDDREVVETVRHLLSSGRVRLCGNFRYAAPSTFR